MEAQAPSSDFQLLDRITSQVEKSTRRLILFNKEIFEEAVRGDIRKAFLKSEAVVMEAETAARLIRNTVPLARRLEKSGELPPDSERKAKRALRDMERTLNNSIQTSREWHRRAYGVPGPHRAKPC